MSRVSDYQCASFNILSDHRPGTNHRICPNRDLRQDDGTCAQHGASSNRYLPACYNAGSD